MTIKYAYEMSGVGGNGNTWSVTGTVEVAGRGVFQLIDQQAPVGLDLHLVVDNYATHKTPLLSKWVRCAERDRSW